MAANGVMLYAIFWVTTEETGQYIYLTWTVRSYTAVALLSADIIFLVATLILFPVTACAFQNASFLDYRKSFLC